MDKILHYIAAFLTGGQSNFLIPLSHQWHGVNVAPALYAVAFLGAFAAVTLAGVACWRLFKRHSFAVPFLLALLFATAAYAASSTLSNLSAGSAISDTDIFYDVQTSGTGGVKVTGLQFKTYLGTTVQTGPGAVGGTCSPGTTCTIQTQTTPTTLSGSNPAITTGYNGGLENLSNGSNQIPTIAEAGTTGFPIGWFTDLCNVGAGTQTLTPASGTVGSASTYVLAAGSAAAPKCIRIVSDGVSNYDVVFPPGSTGGTGNALFGTTTGNTSGDVVTMSNTTVGVQDSGTALTALAPLASPTFTGTPAAPTPGSNVNTTQIPTSAWVNTYFGALAANNPWTGNESHSGTEGFANTITNSLSPAVSQSALTLTGAPQTGGSTTTNFPLLYLNDGTGPTTFSAAGTEIGVNAPSGFTGNLIDLHVNGGLSLFNVSSTGALLTGGVATFDNSAGPISVGSNTIRTAGTGSNFIVETVPCSTANTACSNISITPGANSAATGNNNNGGTVNITGGASTAAGATSNGGSIVLTPGASTNGTPGSVAIGIPSLATSATGGFAYIAAGAGTPTGTPAGITGFVPMYLDTTNSQLWLYIGGAWKQPKTPAGAAVVSWQ